jgi:hypothetical protein
MGGQGPGHKSVRAQQSRRVNIQKARAGRKRAPLPWRSGIESRMIEQLVWQWWMEGSDKWRVTLRLRSGQASDKQAKAKPPAYAEAAARQASDGKKLQQVPHRHPANSAGWVRDDRLGKPWAKLRVARFLGVSHTWVNKLVKKFQADPEAMRRKMKAFAPASIEKLEQAREETRVQRERGYLRGPIRYRRVKIVIQGKKTKVVAATSVERGRRQAEVDAARACLRGEVMRGFPRSKNEHGAPEKTMPVAYRETPSWAKGLLLPGDAGTIPLRGPFVLATASKPQDKQARGPRPVPFAFRRRR